MQQCNCSKFFVHQPDPGETKNIASENSELVDKLTRQMNRGWQAALTEGGE